MAQEILNREQAELLVGRGTVADVAEAAQQLEQFNLDLVTRTSDVITTERQLRNILGLPPADNRRIIPVTPPTDARLEPDWDASLAQMLNFQPDIVQQQLLVRVAELQLLIARNQLLPQLSLNALYQLNGLGQQLDSAEAVMTGAGLKALNPVIATQQTRAGLESNPGIYNNFVTWQLGFTFQAPLGMRSPLANTRQAQYILLRARAYLQQIVHQTTHSLARFFLEIDANYKQFKTASRLRAAAALRLDAQRAYYEEGRITIDRFLDGVRLYATAVATEAQYKTTYNISIVALEEAKGTLLAYDNIAVAEGPHPRKAYIQARDIQDAHRQFPIAPDGQQVPRVPVNAINPDPTTPNPPPGAGELEAQPQPGPAGPIGPRPNPVPPYVPAGLLPKLSQAGSAPSSPRSTANPLSPPTTDVSLTSGAMPPHSASGTASLIDPTVPGIGASSVAASLGRTEATGTSSVSGAAPPPVLPSVSPVELTPPATPLSLAPNSASPGQAETTAAPPELGAAPLPVLPNLTPEASPAPSRLCRCPRVQRRRESTRHHYRYCQTCARGIFHVFRAFVGAPQRCARSGEPKPTPRRWDSAQLHCPYCQTWPRERRPDSPRRCRHPRTRRHWGGPQQPPRRRELGAAPLPVLPGFSPGASPMSSAPLPVRPRMTPPTTPPPSAAAADKPPAADDLPPLPVSIDLPPLPPN